MFNVLSKIIGAMFLWVLTIKVMQFIGMDIHWIILLIVACIFAFLTIDEK